MLKRYWPFLALTLIAVAVYQVWLSFEHFANANGGHLYFKESLAAYVQPSVWVGSYGFGQIDAMLFMVPINFLRGLLAIVGFDANISDKIFFLWPFAFLTGIGSFLLCRYIVKNNAAAFIGALVFCYNTYFIAITTKGHMSLLLAATFAPLGVLFFMRALDERKKNQAIYSALVFFIVSSYDFRIVYMLFFILSFYFLYSVFIRDQFSKMDFLAKTYIYAAFCLVSAGLNLYWIFPLLTTNFFVESDAVNRDVISYSLNTLKAMNLFHPFWTGGIPDWFDGQKISFYFGLVSLMAFGGLFLKRKNSRVVFWGGVAILGILLSKQTGAPFAEIYLWLRDNLPGFGAFREASKFYFIIILAYSILISAFCQFFLEIQSKNGILKKLKFVPVIFAGVLFLWNTKPILTGEIETFFTPKKASEDYVVLKNYLYSQKEYFRVLYILEEVEWPYYDNIHPKIDVKVTNRAEWKEFVRNKGQGSQPKTKEKINSILSQGSSNNLLDISSVKYIVVDPDYFSADWNQFSYLNKVDIGLEELAIFENKNYRPHLYLTNDLETIYRAYNNSDVFYEFISPSEYRIRIEHLKEPGYLNFSEAYYPNWKIRVGEFHWYNVLFENGYFLADRYHFKNDAFLNSFYLDPEYIKNNLAKDQYKINPDGSLDLSLTVYFESQSYLYLGLIISGGILIGSFLYLAWK